MTVIATASRSETKSWVHECGAYFVLDHSKPLAPQFTERRLEAPGFVFSTTHTDQHWADIIEILAPQGKILNEVSALVDPGKVGSTVTEIAGNINVENLRKVHLQIESGTARGKIVLEGF